MQLQFDLSKQITQGNIQGVTHKVINALIVDIWRAQPIRE